MGLFDFASNIGNSIFGSDDDDAGEQLQAHIEEDNPGIEGLEIDVQGDTAVIKGEAESSAAMEKAVLMAGNALGISSVEAGELNVAQQSEEQEPEIVEETETQFYEIQSGDSLWKIAKQFYGNGAKYEAIFAANREVIKDPDLIFPGQKIRIPAEDAE
jgi:nucleoid-associated protein YgaU